MLSPPSRMWSPTAMRSRTSSPASSPTAISEKSVVPPPTSQTRTTSPTCTCSRQRAARRRQPGVERRLRLLEEPRAGRGRRRRPRARSARARRRRTRPAPSRNTSCSASGAGMLASHAARRCAEVRGRRRRPARACGTSSGAPHGRIGARRDRRRRAQSHDLADATTRPGTSAPRARASSPTTRSAAPPRQRAARGDRYSPARGQVEERRQRGRAPRPRPAFTSCGTARTWTSGASASPRRVGVDVGDDASWSCRGRCRRRSAAGSSPQAISTSAGAITRSSWPRRAGSVIAVARASRAWRSAPRNGGSPLHVADEADRAADRSPWRPSTSSPSASREDRLERDALAQRLAAGLVDAAHGGADLLVGVRRRCPPRRKSTSRPSSWSAASSRSAGVSSGGGAAAAAGVATAGRWSAAASTSPITIGAPASHATIDGNASSSGAKRCARNTLPPARSAPSTSARENAGTRELLMSPLLSHGAGPASARSPAPRAPVPFP